jgi:flagellar motility protein MotE (MotC chaperone)
MTLAIRIFPALAVAASLLIGVKAVDFLSGTDSGFGDAIAEEAKHEEAKAEEHRPVAEPAPADEAKASETSHAERPADKTTADLPPELSDPNAMSAAEIAVLQSLSQRRTELEARQREQDMREQLLAATEKKVNERIAELKSLEERIVALLGSREKESEEQLASLVKVYETMKPKDAAKIFEKLEDKVLLSVAQRMKPQKIGAVLAEMDPAQAQSLTVQLARRLELPKEVSTATQSPEMGEETQSGQAPIQELPQSPQESPPNG